MNNSLENISHFLVLGAGTLGLRVGLQAALSGFEVSIVDVDESALSKAKIIQQKLLVRLQKEGRVSEYAFAIQDRINFTTNLEKAVSEADFVNESVTENLDVKLKAWKTLSERCREETILTTNTSYLLPSMLVPAIHNSARFCNFHFHDVFYANVVDIMPHSGTDPKLIPLLMEMGKRLNQIPVVVNKENPGYIFNAMLMALLGTAGQLVINGVSSIEDVDRSWMGNFKMPLGPFGMMDEIGLDTVLHVVSNQHDGKSKRFADFVRPYVEKGKLGVKTKQGFYSYPNPKYKSPDFLL